MIKWLCLSLPKLNTEDGSLLHSKDLLYNYGPNKPFAEMKNFPLPNHLSIPIKIKMLYSLCVQNQILTY